MLEDITHTKLRQFAAEAAALEVGDLLDVAQPGRRHTLLLALLRQARMRCRDELIEMLLRRVRRTQAAAKERLDALHEEHRGIEENLIGVFGQVLETARDQEAETDAPESALARDAAFGRGVRELLAERGGVAALAGQCRTVSAWHRGNELPLLWPIHARHRALLFRLLDLHGRPLGDPGPQLARRARGRERAPSHAPRRGAGRPRPRLRFPALAGLRRQAPPVRARHLRPACARGVRVRPPRRRPAGRRSLRRGRGGLRRLPRPAPAVGGVRGAAAGLLRRPRHPRTGRGLRGRAERGAEPRSPPRWTPASPTMSSSASTTTARHA